MQKLRPKVLDSTADLLGGYTIRKTNQIGIDLIKDWEPFRPRPQLDSRKIWTIGYGHCRTVRAGMEVTIEEAEQLLRDDLTLIERDILRLVTVVLNDSQFAALVAFAFNVGSSAFSQSTLLQLLNRGWYEQVPAQLSRWDRAGGAVIPSLTRRRQSEATLWKLLCEDSDSQKEGQL